MMMGTFTLAFGLYGELPKLFYSSKVTPFQPEPAKQSLPMFYLSITLLACVDLC